MSLPVDRNACFFFPFQTLLRITQNLLKNLSAVLFVTYCRTVEFAAEVEAKALLLLRLNERSKSLTATERAAQKQLLRSSFGSAYDHFFFFFLLGHFSVDDDHSNQQVLITHSATYGPINDREWIVTSIQNFFVVLFYLYICHPPSPMSLRV